MTTLEGRVQRVLASPILRKGFQLLGHEEVVVGRGGECHVVLPSSEVSRRHARFVWSGRSHEVTDLGSTNGTLVNGAAISKPRLLNPGDEIRIGPFVLTYLTVDGSRDELTARFDSRRSPTAKLAVSGRAEPLLTGKIRGDILLEACHLIELNHRSGELRVATSGVQGALRFHGGVIVEARLGMLAGMKAAREILGLCQGDYAFEELEVAAPGPTSLNAKPSALSIEIVRARDESGRLAAEHANRTLVLRRPPDLT